MWKQSANRPWAALLAVGGLILTAVVVFQGIVTAAPPVAAQGAERTSEDRGLRVSFGTEGGRLGMSIDDLDSSETRGSLTEGAIVRAVTLGSPAADAGLEDGDIVVEFDGQRVRSARQLSRLVEETPVGREVPLLVMRDNERLMLSVTPGEGADSFTAIREWMPDLGRWEQRLRQVLPETLRRDREFHFEGQLRGRQRLGIEVTGVGPQLAEYFGVDHGVLVTTVKSGSVAADAGLEAGDVLTAIDGEPVYDIGALHRMVAAIAPPATVQLEVSRDGAALTLPAHFEKTPEPRSRAHRRI